MMMTKLGLLLFATVIAVVFIVIASWLYNCRAGFSVEACEWRRYSELPPREFVEYVSQVLRTNGFTVLPTPDTRSYIRSAESYEDISVFFRGDRVAGEVRIDWLLWDYDGYGISYYLEVKDATTAQAVRMLFDDLLGVVDPINPSTGLPD